METPKKRNHQRKVGILRLIRRDKTIRISLPKCVKWKVICKGCGSQTPGMNLRFGPGIKLKILSKAEPCEMPDTGMLFIKMQGYVLSHLQNIILLIIEA
uniref:Uncharacterized protein n=1 Tax=Callithrix jacchus TaxID=9483 RepID=A0A5F4WLS0_CALJA